MKIVNDFNYPPEIIESARRLERPFNPNNREISITELIDSPQVRRLKRIHRDVEVNMSDLFASWRGSVMHEALSKIVMSDAVQEERLSVAFGEWTISGTPDVIDSSIDIDAESIKDYKFVTMAAGYDGARESHIAQVNLYRWLVFKVHGKLISRLILHYFYNDWKRAQAHHRGASYPKQHEIFIVEPWSIERCEAYVRTRLALHADPKSECSDEERWSSPTIFAIKKKGGKRAINGGRFTSRPDAESFLSELTPNTHEIEIRPGESRRCQLYCNFSAHCQQGLKIIASSPSGSEE